MRRRDLIAAALGAVTATVLASGIAWAAIPEGGVIQGCYDSGGNLKVVASLPCPKGYTPLAWNQQGIQGLPGQDGIDGTDGQDGVSGYEVVSGPQFSLAPGGSFPAASASCPADKVVVGGTLRRVSPLGDFYAHTDIAFQTTALEPGQSFIARVVNTSSVDRTYYLQVSCISI